MSLQSESDAGDCSSDDFAGVVTPVSGNLETESEEWDEVAEDNAAINAAITEAGATAAVAEDGEDFGSPVCGALASSSDEGERDMFCFSLLKIREKKFQELIYRELRFLCSVAAISSCLRFVYI